MDKEAPDRLVDNRDGTHTDRRTGLIWKSQPEVGQFTWNEAMAAFPEHPTPSPTPVPPMELDWSTLGPAIQWGWLWPAHTRLSKAPVPIAVPTQTGKLSLTYVQ